MHARPAVHLGFWSARVGSILGMIYVASLKNCKR